MRKPRRAGRLRLNRETLRLVSAPELRPVAGGAVQSCYCGAGATDPKSNAWTGNQTDYICNN